MRARNKQCKACPWKKEVDPDTEIPDGYCRTKHKGLRSTIANPGTLNFGSLSMMACHESRVDEEYPCVGWLVHQLGPGNNLALRFLARDGRFADIETEGEQCETFEETLKKRRRKKA